MATIVINNGHLHSLAQFEAYKLRVKLEYSICDGKVHQYEIYTTNEDREYLKEKLTNNIYKKHNIQYPESKKEFKFSFWFFTREQDDADARILDDVLNQHFGN